MKVKLYPFTQDNKYTGSKNYCYDVHKRTKKTNAAHNAS